MPACLPACVGGFCGRLRHFDSGCEPRQAASKRRQQFQPCRRPRRCRCCSCVCLSSGCRVGDVGLGRYILYFAPYMTSVEFFVYWQHRMLHMGAGYRCAGLTSGQAGGSQGCSIKRFAKPPSLSEAIVPICSPSD